MRSSFPEATPVRSSTAVVAGIWAGALVMASSGILVGCRMTHNYRSPWAGSEIESFVQEYWSGADVVEDRSIGVVTDGSLVTALPDATSEFTTTVLALLSVDAEDR